MEYFIGDVVERTANDYWAGMAATVIGKSDTSGNYRVKLCNSQCEAWWCPKYFKLIKRGNAAPLPEDSAKRKEYPLYSGLIQYFESALIKVAHHSYNGNEKHNPGQPLHWSRDKSTDHLDAATRHILEGDLVGAAWRILAALQLEEESKGARKAPGAK